MSKLFFAVEIIDDEKFNSVSFYDKDQAEELVKLRNDEIIKNEYGGSEIDWLNDENPKSNTWTVMSEEEFVEHCNINN